MKKIKTPHIEAYKKDVASIVLLPGDPLRAKYIAKHYLTKAKLFNSVRNMLGFTGSYEGYLVSVLGAGVGMSSLDVYVTELIDKFDVKKIIRVGSCGSFHEEIKLNDIIIAQGACTDSRMNLKRFNGDSYAPIPDYETTHKLVEAAKKLSIPVYIGNIFSAELFYPLIKDLSDDWKKYQQFKVLGIEMESANLFTIAAGMGIKAATILGVSDNLVTRAELPAIKRETGFDNMIKIALESLKM